MSCCGLKHSLQMQKGVDVGLATLIVRGQTRVNTITSSSPPATEI